MKRRTILKSLGTGIATTAAAGAAQAAQTTGPDGGVSAQYLECEVMCPDEKCPDECYRCTCIN